MSYVYDASTRTYKQTSTTATKAVSSVSKTTSKIFTKAGSQLAPTANFYQSASRVTISPQAKQLASGVKTTFNAALNATGLSNSTVYLERTKSVLNPQTNKNEDNTLRGFDLLADLSAAELDKMALLAKNGGVTFRFPPGTTNTLDLTGLKNLKADTSEIESILNRLDGNFVFSVDDESLKAGSTNSTLLETVRNTLGKGNRVSNLVIYNKNGPIQSASVSASTVSQLGPNVWSKFSGSIDIRDSVGNLLSQWQDLRVLNNYKPLKVVTQDGIDADQFDANGKKLDNRFVSDLSNYDFKLDYESLISGYSFLKGIDRLPSALSVTKEAASNPPVPDEDRFLVSGKLRNRDHFSLTAVIGTTNYTVDIPPLSIAPTTTSEGRMAILKDAIQSALQAKSDLDHVEVSTVGNRIILKSSNPHAEISALTLKEAGENDTTNFVDITKVPIYALTSLQSLSEVRSISVSTTINALKSNWDLIGTFNNSRPLKNIVLVEESGVDKGKALTSGQDITLTAQEVSKYLPVIEKIDGPRIRITDYPFAMSTYANFSEKAAEKLSASVDLKGSVTDFVKAAAGIAALSKSGKLRSLEITGIENSVIPLDIKSALSLAGVLDNLKDRLKIQITDKMSLSDAALLSKQGIKQSLVGNLAIESDGSDLTSANVRDAASLSGETLTVTKPVNMAAARILSDLSVTPTARLKIEDTITNLLANPSAALQNLIDTIVLTDRATVVQAGALRSLPYASKIMSGIRVADSAALVESGKSTLALVRDAKLLREIAVPFNTTDNALSTLQASLANLNLGSYLTRDTA